MIDLLPSIDHLCLHEVRPCIAVGVVKSEGLLKVVYGLLELSIIGIPARDRNTHMRLVVVKTQAF